MERKPIHDHQAAVDDPPPSRWPQFGLGTLMLIMLVCAVTAAAGSYVVRALSAGTSAKAFFVIFTLVMPVLLVVALNVARLFFSILDRLSLYFLAAGVSLRHDPTLVTADSIILELRRRLPSSARSGRCSTCSALHALLYMLSCTGSLALESPCSDSREDGIFKKQFQDRSNY